MSLHWQVCSCCSLSPALAEEMQQAGVQNPEFQQHPAARTHSVLLCNLGNQLWDRDSNDLERKFGCTEIHYRSLFFFSRTRISLLAVAKLLFVWNCFPTWFGVEGGCFSWNWFCNWVQTQRIHLKQTSSTFNFQRKLENFPCLMPRKWGFFSSKNPSTWIQFWSQTELLERGDLMKLCTELSTVPEERVCVQICEKSVVSSCSY